MIEKTLSEESVFIYLEYVTFMMDDQMLQPMNSLSKSSILSLVLLGINIVYAAMACYFYIDYIQYANMMLENYGGGYGGAGMGLFIELSILAGIAWVVFIPFAIWAYNSLPTSTVRALGMITRKKKIILKGFYFNVILFVLITVAIIVLLSL